MSAIKNILVDKLYYHNIIDTYLKPAKRAYLDKTVNAQYYYLSFYNNKPSGGFACTNDGYLTGLFSLNKNITKDIVQHRINLGNYHNNTKQPLRLFCIGSHLKDFFSTFGFTVSSIVKWDSTQAPTNWDYGKNGTPLLYNMELHNSKKTVHV